MSNKQVILSALKSQLEIKNAEVLKHESEASDPATKKLVDQILDWFKQNISLSVGNIRANSSSIEIVRPNQYNGIKIYLEKKWVKSIDKLDMNIPVNKNYVHYVKLSWYSSSATIEDENTLFDLRILGNVATKLHLIEHEYINVWLPEFDKIDKELYDKTWARDEISRSIRQIEREIREEEINAYKKVGSFCEINNALSVDWDDEGNNRILKEIPYGIKLQYGRSNWDYTHVTYFEVLRSNKYKTSLKVKTFKRTEESEIEISTKRFDEFVDNVYDWQNGGSEKYNEGIKKRYDSFMESKNQTV